jgi:glycerate kinase
MVRVIVASDKFKGSLTSAEVATAVAAGLGRVHPGATVVHVPVADGGDGTLAAAVAAGYELVPVLASGPTGTPVSTGYARSGDTAVVELADTSGLVRLPGGVPAPMTATSRGTGEVMAAAIDAGCTRVILGIGGSASTDGGEGLVEGLGDRMTGVQIVVACDVDNPLTGPRGAAAVYGPQKGASPEQVVELDDRLTRWADRVAELTGRDLRDAPGAGAAGGVGFAALALLGAELRPGIDLILDMVHFQDQLTGTSPPSAHPGSAPALHGLADLVITGEGALDEQTLHGKAVAGVAAAARASGVPVVAVCGVNRLSAEQLRQAGVEAAYALHDIEPDLRKCIAEPGPLLEEIGERIGWVHLRMAGSERGFA